MIQYYNKGDVIIEAGAEDKEAYIIETGECAVYKNDIQLCILQKNSIFGEIGWLQHLPRTATVTAHTDCLVHVLTEEDAQLLIKHNPKALMPVLKIVCNRMADVLDIVKEK